ncbi:MAG: VOC family protein [Gammaproteobacteria bacterium]
MKKIKPDHAPWITPYITVKDVDAAKTFYETAFHFVTTDAKPGEDGTLQHLEMTYHQQLIMFGKQGAWGSTTLTPNSSNTPCPINLYLYCENVDDFFQHALKAGAQSIVEPQDTFWGDRMCQMKDPDGFAWCFATMIDEKVHQH